MLDADLGSIVVEFSCQQLAMMFVRDKVVSPLGWEIIASALAAEH